MKIKRLIILGLILAVLTIGAVSAAEDTDALAVEDDVGEVIEVPAEDIADESAEDADKLAQAEADDELAEVSKDDFNVVIVDGTLNTSQSVAYVAWDEDLNLVGNSISVSVDGVDTSTWQITDGIRDHASFTLNDLKINKTGEYFLSVKFISSDQTIDIGNRTITVKEFSKDYFDVTFADSMDITDEGNVFEIDWDYGLDGKFVVNVNENAAIEKTVKMLDDASYALNLANLGITKGGKYKIKVQYVKGDNALVLIDDNLTVNVEGGLSKDDFYVGIINGTLNTSQSVAYVEWDEDLNLVGNSISVSVDGVDTSTWQITEGIRDHASFTLNDLKINKTGDYLLTVRFISSLQDIEIESKTITVKEFSKDYFDVIFSDSMVLTDENVFAIDWDYGLDGKFVVNVDENEAIEETVGVNDYYYALDLAELNITKAGKYKIKVQYVKGDNALVLIDDNLTVVKYNISAEMEENVVPISYEGNVISVRWEGQIEGTLFYGLKDTSIGQKSLAGLEEDFLNFYFADFGITKAGTYNIEIQHQPQGGNLTTLLDATLTVCDFDLTIEDDKGIASSCFLYGEKVVIKVLPAEFTGVKLFVNDAEVTLENNQINLTAADVKIGYNAVRAVLSVEGQDDQVMNKTFKVMPYVHIEILGNDDFERQNKVSTEDEVYVDVEMPENTKGTVTIYKGLDIRGDVIVTETADGMVKIKLPLDKFDLNEYNHMMVVYDDGNYTFESDIFSFGLYENNPNVQVEIPSKVYNGTEILVNVTAPSGDGSMFIYVNGELVDWNGTDTGDVKFDIGELALGNHSITINCNYIDDNDNDVFYSKTFTIEVVEKSKLDPKLNVSIDVDDYGNIEVTATAEKNATGNVTISIIDSDGNTVKSERGELDNGSFVLGGMGFYLDSGLYNFTASYEGDENYTAATAVHATMLTKRVPTFDPVAYVNEYGFIIVKATINDDATGNITFRLVREGEDPKPEDDETVEIENGTAEFDNPARYAKGKYLIYVTYNGDRTYYMAYIPYLEANVNKTYIDPKTTQLDVEGGEINVTVDLGVNATGNVHVVYPSGYVDNVTIKDGKVNFYNVFMSETGPLSVVLDYDGDDNYYGFYEYFVDFTIKKATFVTAKPISVVYKNNAKWTINLKDADLKPLSGQTIKVTVNGKTYTGKTDAKGNAVVTIPANMVPKAYTAKIVYAGTELLDDDFDNVKFTVKKATPKLTAKKKTFKAKTKVKKYTIVLKDHKKKAMKKVKVYIKVKGKTYAAKTNSKGKATFKIKNLKKKGTYKAKVTFKATKYFNKVTKTVKIKVKK